MTRRKRTEDKSLETYYKWLQAKGWATNYYHYPAEIPAYDKSMTIFIAGLKRKGKKAGFSDIVILEPHQGYAALFIELKTKTGTPTLEQCAFISNVNNNGFLGCVAYGLDSALELTEWYMGESPTSPPFKKVTRKRKQIDFEILEVGK